MTLYEDGRVSRVVKKIYNTAYLVERRSRYACKRVGSKGRTLDTAAARRTRVTAFTTERQDSCDS